MNIYHKRRDKLAQKMGPNSVAIIPSARLRTRNNDVHYPFRQNSDFQYLTGFPEDDAVAVIAVHESSYEYSLFCKPKNPTHELWEGKIIGQEDAIKDFGVDKSFPFEEFNDRLAELCYGSERIFYPFDDSMSLEVTVNRLIKKLSRGIRLGVNPPIEKRALSSIVHEMRVVKEAQEIELMQQAVDITVDAHKSIMKAVKTSQHEYEIEATYTHACAMKGARFQAYSPIIASGDNACVLHYKENNDPIPENSLLLTDAGCEYEGYASDLTRTIPVNGVFSEEQKIIYNIVLEAQLAAIAEVEPGNHWRKPHHAAVRSVTQGLLDIGVLSGDIEQLIADEAYAVYFPHQTGHWIGMDVHDVGAYKVKNEWRVFEPGMVLTVEPGIYFGHGVPCDEKWRGIGIRIEDDVLVTENGARVLSENLPKTVEEIEAYMAD